VVDRWLELEVELLETRSRGAVIATRGERHRKRSDPQRTSWVRRLAAAIVRWSQPVIGPVSHHAVARCRRATAVQTAITLQAAMLAKFGDRFRKQRAGLRPFGNLR